MYKYKLVKKINPQDKEAPKKWYAIPISEVPQTVKAMTRAATENTTTAPIEMEAALELLGRHAFNSKMPEYWTKASAMPALQTIKKPKALLPVEVVTAVIVVMVVAIPETVMEVEDLDNLSLIQFTKYLSLFPFQVKLTGGCTTEKGSRLIICFNRLFSMLLRY